MWNSKKCSSNIYSIISSIYSDNGKYKIMGAWIILILITTMCFNALIKE